MNRVLSITYSHNKTVYTGQNIYYSFQFYIENGIIILMNDTYIHKWNPEKKGERLWQNIMALELNRLAMVVKI